MPELPEVEVLVRHLAPVIRNRKISGVEVRRAKVLGKTSPERFRQMLLGGTFTGVTRRGKYLLFNVRKARSRESLTLIGHLGMTGRMYLLPTDAPLPKHTPVVLNLGRENFVFEDTRYFGRLTFDEELIDRLGPEPLGEEFTVVHLTAALKRSSQAIKVRLLDQSLVAGVGNIYASEALFQAGISPRKAARRLKADQVAHLWSAIRETLADAIKRGSTVPLNFSGINGEDRLFYFGLAPGAEDFYEERLRVYDRVGKPCIQCGTAIRQFTQAARSTYYCPKCQR